MIINTGDDLFEFKQLLSEKKTNNLSMSSSYSQSMNGHSFEKTIRVIMENRIDIFTPINDELLAIKERKFKYITCTITSKNEDSTKIIYFADNEQGVGYFNDDNDVLYCLHKWSKLYYYLNDSTLKIEIEKSKNKREFQTNTEIYAFCENEFEFDGCYIVNTPFKLASIGAKLEKVIIQNNEDSDEIIVPKGSFILLEIKRGPALINLMAQLPKKLKVFSQIKKKPFPNYWVISILQSSEKNEFSAEFLADLSELSKFFSFAFFSIENDEFFGITLNKVIKNDYFIREELKKINESLNQKIQKINESNLRIQSLLSEIINRMDIQQVKSDNYSFLNKKKKK